MKGRRAGAAWALHLAVVALLFALQFVLPPYHHTNAARIMVLASYALGYNLLLGYSGLMSLGHALFFASGMYGAGLAVYHLGFGGPAAFGTGVLAALVVATLLGLVVLRTSGVSFLIVTLMFAQTAFLSIAYFNEFTGGDDGLILSGKLRPLLLFGRELPFSAPEVKYNLALLLFAACLLAMLALIRSPFGRVLVAIRENEPRTRMLGYDTQRHKLLALVLSGTISGAAGALYALLFSYVGSSFAGIEYSILPLLWTLLGGAGTVLGPLLGTALMFYLVDFASGFTASYLLLVGVALVLLVLWFPRGILGSVRERWLAWLP